MKTWSSCSSNSLRKHLGWMRLSLPSFKPLSFELITIYNWIFTIKILITFCLIKLKLHQTILSTKLGNLKTNKLIYRNFDMLEVILAQQLHNSTHTGWDLCGRSHSYESHPMWVELCNCCAWLLCKKHYPWYACLWIVNFCWEY
jgi:hypothetical protein